MKKRPVSRMRYSLYIVIMLALVGFVLACGPGEEPTAIPTATAKPVVAATSTPIPAGPVATPTPTKAPVPTPTATAKKGGVMNQGITASFQHYDAQTIASGAASWVPPAFNNLFYYTGKDYVCELCVNEQYTLENAGKTIVINIKPGIKFHNGQEMTAADVKYSLEKMIGTADGVASARCGNIKSYITSIEAPSTYGLRINLVRPSSFVPKAVSAHYCSIYPAGTTRDQLKGPGFGSGPYIVKENVAGSHLAYVRNPNYFKPGLPYLDGVTVWKLADSTAIVVAFLAGKLDTTTPPINNPPTDFEPQIAKLVAEGKVVAEKADDISLAGKAWLVDRFPFDNIKIRQAANLAIDRTAFGDGVFDPGRWQAGLMFVSSTGWGRPESQIWDVVPGWGRGAKKLQEIEQAKQLVKDAGYPNGFDTREIVDTTTGSGVAGTSEPELLQAALAKVGIRMPLKIMATADKNTALAEGKYGIGNLSTASVTGDPDEWLGGFFITGASSNISRYSNKEFDDLFLQMSSEPDIAKRKQMVRQLEDILFVRDIVYAAMPQELQNYYRYSYVKGWSAIVLGEGGSNVLRKETLWLDGKP